MNKATAIIIGIIILCFGGFVVWSIVTTQTSSTNYDKYDSANAIPPSAENGEIGDHVRGNAESQIVVIEYADFQCGGCATINPKLDTVVGEYGDRVAFIFRNFPINGHQNARAAASAAEAAGLQGYFFEMSGTLFLNQAIWSYASGAERTDVFADLFQQVAPAGNISKFKTDIGDPGIAKKVSFDYDIGVKKDKVTSTPSIFVDGELIDIAKIDTDFVVLLREKLDAKLAKLNLPTGPIAPEETPDL